MGSLSEGQRAAEERIKSKIVEYHRLGVCDSEGRSIKRRDGSYVAKPRTLGKVTYHVTFPRHAHSDS
jgi:hypothetical protein